MNFDHKQITEQIIGAAFEAHRVLGYGFLEKVYHRALQVELQRTGLSAELEPAIKILYKNVIVGNYFADLLVDDVVIVEIKADKTYNSEHEAQLLNELKGTGIKVGLLINFGRHKVEFKRMVF